MRMRAARNERVLVTTLTKKMAENLTEYYRGARGARALSAFARFRRLIESGYFATCERVSSMCWLE